jgi:hypothetical protein
MRHHVIKLTHEEGVVLNIPTLWCNQLPAYLDWYFQDAQHVVLSVGSNILPCKKCVKGIIKELEKSLEEYEV